MEKFFSFFWTLIVFASIAWYVFLLVYVGIKGGIEILQMTQRISDRPAEEPPDGQGAKDKSGF